jgi:hypothetical protein
MALHAEASDLATIEFRETLDALGIAQHRVARLFGVGPRSVRRWQDGDRRVPCGVGIVLRLLAAGAVTVDQVEQAAAVAIPAWTNGSATPEPSAPLLVEPVPEPSVVTDVKAAAFADSTFVDPTLVDLTFADPTLADPASADPGQTTAEKVVALSPEACRWPYGDPGRSDFCFCGRPVARRPYCERHRITAYAASSTGSVPGFGAARRRRRSGLW